MTAQELFDGLADKRAQLETDLAERHGEGVRTHFRTAEQRTQGWQEQDYLTAQQQAEELEDRVLALLRAGEAPDSAPVLEVMAQHYAYVAQFWTPDRESYTGLGRLYVEDPDFRARYDAKDPRLAEYLRDATAAYAQQRLS